jgi:hypothetical protein
MVGMVSELMDGERLPSTLSFNLEEYSRRIRIRMPWVERLNAIDLKPNGQMEISAEYRRPLMALTLPDEPQILLDRHATVLRSADVRKDILDQMIEFNYAARLVQQSAERGSKVPAKLRPGELWDDPKVLESLRLAEFITKKSTTGNRSRSIFRLIDCSSVRDTLLLRTTDRLWVVWGQSPGHEKPGEPDAESKWKFLANWLRDNSGQYHFDLERSMILFEKDRAVLTTINAGQ